MTTTDPLLAPWTGAHGGYPPLDKIRGADLEPALYPLAQTQKVSK